MSCIKKSIFIVLFLSAIGVKAQDFYFKEYAPFNKNIPTPEAFLGYNIGESHTRHDLIVAYIEKLASLSDRATVAVYGYTNEHRKLLMLTITSPKNHKNLDSLKQQHLKVVNGKQVDISKLPIFINLGYNVHGNEPSGSEAALLTAYTLIASENTKVLEYLEKTVIFLDPTINPDGRDRTVNWVNRYKGNPLITDKFDIEHNEAWPKGRTNHYQFDLNRDLLLAVQPESQARLKWFHSWYPNVITDFHEMSTKKTYFFEPKPLSASLEPVTPDENYELTKHFAKGFITDLNKNGSLYFTKEIYDATYPGYGSTYGDLQGSLAILFEQAGVRGHLIESQNGDLSFQYAIKNQFIATFATIKSAILNKDLLYKYQNTFFKKAMDNAKKSKVKAYVFGDNYDKNRTKYFIDLLLKHQIKVYPLERDIYKGKKTYKKASSFIVPTNQQQNLMVRTMFETNRKYRDSVFYDASSWSVANFYNMKYDELSDVNSHNNELTTKTNKVKTEAFSQSNYAYLISWNDYNAPALLNALLEKNVHIKIALKSTKMMANDKAVDFGRGSMLIPMAIQDLKSDEIYAILKEKSAEFNIQVYAVNTGYSLKGIDLGSVNFVSVKQPKVMLLVGEGTSAYETGEVWQLFEQRLKMPITKVPLSIFNRINLQRYQVMVMVSGNYKALSEKNKTELKNWVKQGNTLITIKGASSWAISNNIVNEEFVKKAPKKAFKRIAYKDARGTIGKQRIGGAIFKVDLDLSHPIAFGYHDATIPMYKNNRIFIKPSKNPYSTVAMYTAKPHVDGFVTQENIDNYITKSASIIVSGLGKGRVVLFADNPNFRGAWYGTNKLFENAVFFGNLIKIP